MHDWHLSKVIPSEVLLYWGWWENLQWLSLHISCEVCLLRRKRTLLSKSTWQASCITESNFVASSNAFRSGAIDWSWYMICSLFSNLVRKSVAAWGRKGWAHLHQSIASCSLPGCLMDLHQLCKAFSCIWQNHVQRRFGQAIIIKDASALMWLLNRGYAPLPAVWRLQNNLPIWFKFSLLARNLWQCRTVNRGCKTYWVLCDMPPSRQCCGRVQPRWAAHTARLEGLDTTSSGLRNSQDLQAVKNKSSLSTALQWVEGVDKLWCRCNLDHAYLTAVAHFLARLRNEELQIRNIQNHLLAELNPLIVDLDVGSW